MKKCISKILAGIIALAMILGNFTGMGMVAYAAPLQRELVIRVVNEKGEAIPDVWLILKNDELGDIDFENETDSSGEVILSDELISVEKEATYLIQPDDSTHNNFICDAPIQVHFKINDFDRAAYIDTVNGSSQEEIELVIKDAGGNQPAKPNIDKVTSSITEASWKGDTASITVTGTSLPEKLCYQIWYKAKNNVESEIGAIKSVQVTGTDAERKFNVNIPAISAYPDSVLWIVKVIELENPKLSDAWSRVEIGIKKDTVTAETKAALKTAIDEMGSLTESDYTAKSWNAYKAAIDAANPLLTKQDATNTECQAAIQSIEKAKAALVLKRDLASESTKTALKAAIDGTTGYNGANYTTASWKAFSAAVANAKSLLADSDATETQCQEAIREIERTKAALVIAKVNVSNITISGLSKTIAVGKKIQLTAKVSPANATNKTVKWTTSNKKYATVDSKGMVSVKKAGAGKTVTITAAATDGSGKKAAYKIKIMKNAVKSIKLKAAKSVKAGKSLKVKATVKTSGKKANKTLKWTSSNTKYATVSSKGVVKTKKAGKGKKVKITAMSTDGSSKKKTVTVTIK